jgi:hypothetical protein
MENRVNCKLNYILEIKPTDSEINFIRNSKDTAIKAAEELGIPVSRVYKIRAYIKYYINKEVYNPYSTSNKKFRKLSSLLFLYEISDDGVLRNVKSKKVLHGTICDGYKTFTFPKSFKSIYNSYNGVKKFRCHQLVMEAFGNSSPNSEYVIDHIDRNKLNNSISNLRWVSRLENKRNSDYFENQKKPVLVDGVKYESRWSAARYIAEIHNKNIKAIDSRLRRKRSNIYNHKIEYCNL